MRTLHTVPFSFHVKELTHGISYLYSIYIFGMRTVGYVTLASVRTNASSNEVWMFSFLRTESTSEILTKYCKSNAERFHFWALICITI